MARNRQPILKKCRALGIEPMVLGVNKTSKEDSDQTQIENLQNMQYN